MKTVYILNGKVFDRKDYKGIDLECKKMLDEVDFIPYFKANPEIEVYDFFEEVAIYEKTVSEARNWMTKYEAYSYLTERYSNTQGLQMDEQDITKYSIEFNLARFQA